VLFAETRTFRAFEGALRVVRVGGRSVAALQMMDERGGDVGGVETFLEQTFDEMILFLYSRLAQSRREVCRGTSWRGLRELRHSRQFCALNARVGITLDVADLKQFASGDKRNRTAVRACATGSIQWR